MSFQFQCPKCSYLITEKDFKENEKVLNHLNEIFNQRRTEYIQILKNKLEERYQNDQNQKIKLALIERETQLNKSFQTRIDELNKTITTNKIIIDNHDSILKKTLAEYQLKLNQEKQDEIISLKNQIKDLENNNKMQKDMLEEKILAKVNAKETELIKAFQNEVNNLKEIINQKQNIIDTKELQFKQQLGEKEAQLNKIFQTRIDELNKTITTNKIIIDNHDSILKKTLAEYQLKLNQEKQDEIELLKTKIFELEKANLQSKVIQNKIKGVNFEHEVESELRKVFEPDDVITKITDQDKKADYLQEVRQDNNIIGKIVYEVKNAEWNNNWEKKLIDDMAKQNSKYGILIATSFNNKYPSIPFKRSDYNPNIYLTNSESFYFVGQILRTLIKIEYRLESNRNKNDYNEKIAYFNDWKAAQLPKLSQIIESSCSKIKDSEKSILNKLGDIRIAREKIYKNWIENIKEYLENFIF